jgi:divalent metal cation (Fe/Co/Zn/Cd) transporter
LTDRPALLRRGVLLEAVTVAYDVLEGLVGIAAGLAAGSVALTGFGVDSLIEVTSGIVLWWRLRAELGSPPLRAVAERRAARLAGTLLLLLGGYLAVGSIRRLVGGARPRESLIGIALTALALIVMPLLARAKLRTAAALDSRALRADAHEAIVCAWLACAALLGLLLNALLGWWWADPVAALAMLPLVAREGVEALHEEEA